MRAACRLVLSLLLLLSTPGTEGFLLYAQEEYDPNAKDFKAQAKVTAQAQTQTLALPPQAVAPRLKLARQKIMDDPRLAEDQRQQAVDFLNKYETAISHDPDHTSQQALDAVVKDLSDPKKDPGIALAGMFDRLQDASRQAESGGTYVQYLNSSPTRTTVRVASELHGKTLYIQDGVQVKPGTTLKTITRPDPDDPRKPDSVEAIILEEKKGAATDQRVYYNRKVHQLFANLKKLYFDQCGVVRRINNGEAGIITNTTCLEPAGIKDEKLTEDVRRKLQAFYEKNQARFPQELLKYLAKLDDLKAKGKLSELNDYKELERMQRLAMAFYNQNQLETYQRAVIMEITNYMSAATNVQPKQKKGDEQLDIGAKDLSDFQHLLDQYKKGDMEGYSWFLKKLGWSELSENDRKVMAPAVMNLASEAFADVAYAAKAQERLLDPNAHLSGPERDALIEEAGQWLRLTQIQVQSFDLQAESMSLMKLSKGTLRGIGIQAADKDMIAQAETLAKTAKEQYFPLLQKANLDAKQALLRQTVATFWTTYRDVVDAFLFDSSAQERVKLLSGKADQLLQLYLSREYDKAVQDPAYAARFSASEKVEGGAYAYFLENLPQDVAALRGELQTFIGRLKGLESATLKEIHDGLPPLEPDFKRLVKAVLGTDKMPSAAEVQKEAQRQALAQGRLFASTQDFSNNMRLFDMVNELEIYVDKYASSKWVSTEHDTFWTQLASFQWVNKSYDFITLGTREDAADYMLGHFHVKIGPIELDCREAFEKLKAHPERREAMDKALRAGDFREVMRLAAQIDEKGSARASQQAKLDKLDEDKSDLLDLDGMMGHAYDNETQTKALGGVVGGFGLLPTLIKGYAGATAITDIVITSVLTAVGGPLISYASRYAEYLVGAGKFIQPAELIGTADKLNLAQRAIRFGASLPGKVLLEYPGKVILNSGRTFRKVLSLPAAADGWAAAKQVGLLSTWKGAFGSAISSTLMMAGISSGMQGISYEMNSDTSQYASFSDAVTQGFVQGASFGAKAGLIMHISPMPAAAFEGRFGDAMRVAAETPGPISFVSQKVAQIIPGLSKSAVAESGALGAVSQVTMNAGAGWYLAGKALVFGGGIFDGTLKYMAAAYVPQQLVQIGSMIAGDLSDRRHGIDPNSETESGSTVFMDRLASAQAFSMTFAEISWVLMPTNPAFSPKEIKDQVSQASAYNRIVNKGPEFAREIELGVNGQTIEVEKPWYTRTMGEHLRNLIGTVYEPIKPANTETFTINEQYRQQAMRRRLKGMSTEEVIALRQAPSEGNGRVVEIKTLVDGLRDPKALAEQLKNAGSKVDIAADGSPLITTPATKDAVDIRNLKIRDPLTKKWRDAREGEARIVERPVKLGANATPAVLEVKNAKGEWVPVGTNGAPVARISASGTETQVRISNETISAATAELEARLTGRGTVKRFYDAFKGTQPLDGAALRSKILLAGDKLVFENGAEMSGTSLANLKKSAARAQLDEMPATTSATGYARDIATRTWDALFGTKLETQQQRTARFLRNETQADAEALAKSPEKRLGAVSDMVGELKDRVSDPADQATFERVTKILSSGGASEKVISQAVKELDAAAKAKTADSPGVLPDTFKNLSATLNGEITADLVMTAARRRIGDRITGAKGADQAALKILRQSLETDASRQVVIAKMLESFGGSHAALVKEINGAAKSKDKGALDRAVDLYTDVWERAAFGQMAGERVMGKDGKLTWSIPAEREFKNRYDIAIAEFRPLQKRVIKETLGFISEGNTLIFGQMPTGGGKTLTNFTLIEFLDALAHEQGREGVIYLTTNPDLVAQAKEDYMAFFGKKPSFEVMTYGDLSARVAQAKEQGLPSPMAKFHLVGDEGDRPASEVPTSVGLFNGKMSKAQIDPVQRVMQDAANRFVDGDLSFWEGARAKYGLTGEVTEAQYEHLLTQPEFRKAIEEGQGGFYRQMQLKYDLKGTISDGQFRTLMENKDFAADFQRVVRGTDADIAKAFKTLKSREFRDNIDLTKYPEYLALYEGNPARARSELQRTMIEEYKHMVHTADLLHGGLKGRLAKFFKGGLEFSSEPERSKKLVPDPDPNRGVLNFNNGIAYDNLSTDVGPFGSAYYRRPISNEFESAGTLDFAGLIEEAVAQKSILFLTSGTCASKIREIMINRYGAKFTGETSIADPYMARSAKPGEDAFLVKQKVDYANKGNLSVNFVNSLEDARLLEDAFIKAGMTPEQMATITRPGSNLQEQERMDEKVKGERNVEGFEKGTVKIVFIVGAAGLRGLEMNLKEYKGKEAWMDIVDPQELDTDSRTQLIGRLSIGRAWMLNLRRFTTVTRIERVMKSETLPRAVPELSKLIEGVNAGADMRAAEDLALEIHGSDLFKGATYSPKALLDAIQAHELDVTRFTDEVAAYQKGPKAKKFDFKPEANALYDDVILQMLKTPSELRAGNLVTDIVETFKLREGLTDAERQAILDLPAKDRQAAVRKLFTDPAVLERPEVLEVLITSLGRQEQDIAIGASGILNAKGTTGKKNIRDLFKFFKPKLPPGGAAGPGPAIP